MHRKSLTPHFLPWMGWLVASFAGLFQFLLQTSSSVMIMDLEKAFSLNSLGVSLLSSSYFYTYLVCQIPAGLIVDRFKPRRTLILSQCLLALGCILFATSINVWMACASRVWMGIVCAPTFIVAFYLIARTLPEKYFALLAGLTETLGMLGGVAGEALLARSVTAFGWQHTVLILAGIAFVMAMLVWLTIRDEVRLEAAPTQSESFRQQVWLDLFSMLKMPQAWINGLFCGLLFSILAAFGAFWCIPFLMQLYGIPLGRAADASSMIFIGAALGTPTIGWLSDRLETRRGLMIICSLIALVLFLVILYFPPFSITWMFVLIFMLGLFSAVYVLPFAVIRDITPVHMRGTAMGYINMMCILIGSPLLQPFIGWLLHANAEINRQAYQQALMIIPVSLMIAFVLAFFVQEV